MIGPAIESQCTDNTLINQMIAGRIYPKFAPQEQKQYPRIVYDIDDAEGDGPEDHTFDGQLGIIHETVTISALARTRKDANRLGVMIRELFEGQDGTWAGIEVQGAFFVRLRNKEYSLDDANQDFLIYSREITIEFIFNEPEASEV